MRELHRNRFAHIDRGRGEWGESTPSLDYQAMTSHATIPAPYLLIAAGGTGGHLFPAQELARRLRRCGLAVHFAGAQLSRCPYFDPNEFSSVDIESPPLALGIRGLLGFGLGLCRGIQSAWTLLRARPPVAIVGFGSYHTVAVLSAGALLRIPILLHEANADPGRVSRLFTPLAQSVAVQFAALAKRGGAKYHLSRMPLHQRWTREVLPIKPKLFEHFGLSATQKTLLVFGGSQGAHFFNDRIPQIFAETEEKALREDVQILHLAGAAAHCTDLQNRYSTLGLRACVRPFEVNMHWAWAIADFAICRAGGSTLAEVRHFCVPALLIPLPGARGHQTSNARHFIEETRGALWLPQHAASVENLTRCLLEIFSPLSQTHTSLRKALSKGALGPQPSEIEEWVLSALKMG